MYKHGINMNNVLMLTFTNKAADEMKMRAERELPGISNDLTACTFHSFCVKLLKEYGSMAGIGDFTILSENDSADAMDVAKNNMYEYLKTMIQKGMSCIRTKPFRHTKNTWSIFFISQYRTIFQGCINGRFQINDARRHM